MPTGPSIFQPTCAVCGRPSATIRIETRAGELCLVYDGPGGATGPEGSPITPEQQRAIAAAFTPPYQGARIKAVDFHDDAGFCEACGCFYCPTHWNISSIGCGTCPRGHLKSLDPHWSPE